MKKIIITSGILFMFLGSLVAMKFFFQNMRSNQKIDYNEYITDFKKMNVDEWNGNLKNLSGSYIYFGRATCPDCQNFVPKLSEQAKQKNITVYYVDTEDKNNKTLSNIRNTLEIDWVPTFGFIYENKFIKLNKEKTITSDDISDFIDKFQNNK